MTPIDWRLWMHAGRVKELCPGDLLSVCGVYESLQEARRLLSNSGANFLARCARDNNRYPCELPRQLAQWNRLLAPANVRLREGNAPGELSVLCVNQLPWERHCRIQRAVLLFHWLLIQHPCVVALQVDFWGMFNFHVFFDLFCDGLLQCHRLKSLKLRVDCVFVSVFREFMGAICDLRHLEEFTLGTKDVRGALGNMTHLCNLIASNAKLKRLEVHEFIGVSTRLWCIPLVLAMNVRLTDLCLDVSSLQASECGLFSLALKENRSLKSLRLINSLLEQNMSVAAVARALEGATLLTTLELCYFHVTVGEAWALVTSLSSTNSLQQLILYACVPVFSKLACVPCSGDNGKDSSSPASWHINPFVHMLHKLKSLRKLMFPLSSYPLEDQRAFFEALRANDSIEDVRVHSLSHRYFSELCRLASETGTDNRGTFGTVPADGWRLKNVSEASFSRDISILIDLIGPPVDMCRRFRLLTNLNSLTTLIVDVGSAIHTEAAQQLGRYLRGTQLLKDVTLSFFAHRDEALVLLDALSHNTSITALVVEKWCRSSRTTRLLVDVVCSSKNITALTYHLATQDPSPAFFPALSQNIERNCTILSVETHIEKRVPEHWIRIQEVVNRNHTLLVHAARCVTGCALQKSGAEALELMPSNPMLASKVQEIASMSEKEAKDAIKSRLADLEGFDFFMSIAGVVRERVVCKEICAQGRACLGMLPDDCWRALRRYLRVADVVDRPQMC